MEDLALSLDRRNAEDLMRPPAPATPGCQLDQVKAIQDPDEPSSLIEACEPVPGDSDPTGVSLEGKLSLEDTIRKYIPDLSDSALATKERKSRCWMVNDQDIIPTSDKYLIDSIRTSSRRSKRLDLLIIQDVNLDWCKALCAKYKAALDPETIMGHIVRFDKISPATDDAQAVESDLARRYPGLRFQTCSSGNFTATQANRSSYSQPFAIDESNLRLNLVVEASRGKAREHLSKLRLEDQLFWDLSVRQEILELDDLNEQRRISAQVSCFRLEADFYLILLDSIPLAAESSANAYHSSLLRIEHNDNQCYETPRLLPSDSDFVDGEPVAESILSLFRRHTLRSILQPRSLQPELSDRQRGMNRDVFVWLLIESNWRISVKRLELQLQKLQWEATNIAGDQAFMKLTSFRRQLAEAYEMLSEARNTVERELSESRVSWRVERRGLHAGESRSEKRDRPVAVEHHRKSEIDIRDLPELLEELLGRIHAMTHAVNEEIQMVIGAVQVEDARVMRRQTEWTVVLAVLAAVYLPMSLVTGIFGMNITEIDAGATAPNRWSVVNAWGVVLGATMGSVLVYAMARYVFRYRRVGVMLLGRGMRKVGKGRLYRNLRRLKDRLQESWLYLKIDGFREKMRELDLEAQKMGKME